jgi:general secretion pathway protein K
MKNKNEQGMALAVVLMVMALLTAMVVEFAYGVNVKTNMLNNWYSLQRLSLAADSGASVAARIIDYMDKNDNDIYVALPAQQVFDQPLSVSLFIKDEYSRFNLNTLVQQNGYLNEKYYNALIRMLKHIELEPDVADRIVDWIDPDEFARVADSEGENANKPLSSIEEVLQIPGIDNKTYAKLKPYITVYGNGKININLADEPVLMAISEDMTEDMAELIISGRSEGSFRKEAELYKAAPGFQNMKDRLSVFYKGDIFRIISHAEDLDSLVREVECVIRKNGTILYWKES